MKSKLFLTALLVLAVTCVSGQNMTVSGTVSDGSTGEPIPFASVQIKGVAKGTTTDGNGAFALSVPPDATLAISFIGYTKLEIPVNGRSRLEIRLSPDGINLDDVLIVAYGTVRKESFTGSAQVIGADKIERRTVSNITKALDGVAAGVISTSGSGQPGAGSSVVIRGFGSLNASNSPLYVVDGVPYDGALNSINPGDIESMTVMKDASAGALYGARGANGVVLIHTKRGREGNVSVQFKGNWGIASRAIPQYDLMDSYEWTENMYSAYLIAARKKGYLGDAAGRAALNEMANGTDGIFGINEQYNPFSRPVPDLIDIKTGKIKEGTVLKWDEDWLDEVTARNPFRQEYILTVAGGSPKTTYMFSMGYLDQNGLVATTKFRRFTGRANMDAQVKEWFRTGLNVNFSNNKSNATSLGTSAGSSTNYSNVFYSCANIAPIYPLYKKDAEGNTIYDAAGNPRYDWGDYRPAGANPGVNPVANLYKDKYDTMSDNMSGRTFIDLGGWKEGPVRGLKFSMNFGFDYMNTKSSTYYNPDFGNAATERGYLGTGNGRTFSYTFNQLLTYNRNFGKHTVDFLLGHEYYDYNYQYTGASKTGVVFEGLYELNGFVTNDKINGYSNNYKIDSYLSRLNYGYDDKYYVSGSFRRDASSRFHKDYRWGNFWSAGASWRISRENFLKDIRWINNLTLKASYGVQGNDNIGSYYAWQQLFSVAYPNGGYGGVLVSTLETKDLKWEKNRNLNIGIEARLLNRLSASFEWYRRKTEDMLMDYPIAMSLGFSKYNKNIGSMLNRGFEISLSGDVIRKNGFNWNLALMGSTIRNEVLTLTTDRSEIKSGNFIIREGEALNSFYLAKSAGIDPANGDKLYYIWTDNEETGEREYIVTNNYSKATAYREVCGSRIPDLYGSIINDLRIGNLDINILTTYSIGGKILDNTYYDYLYNTYVGAAMHKDRAGSWKNPGDVTSIPRIDNGKSANIIFTEDNLISASYFAIKNVTLGYTLPKKWTDALRMHSVRITVSGDNLALFSARKGLDPQYNFSGTTGYTYTPERTLSLGLDIQF